jgi:hypothetical protein
LLFQSAREAASHARCLVHLLGIKMGFTHTVEKIHFLLEEAFVKDWDTSEFEHCGIKQGGEEMFARLTDLGRGEVER